MTKVLCPYIECKNNRKQRCTCKEITFTGRNMATVNEGRVDMWVCNQYEMTEEAKALEDKFKRFFKGDNL